MRSIGSLERALRIALTGALLLAETVAPATITVSGSCTLADAIIAANQDARSSGCPPGSGDDIVQLTGDVELIQTHDGDNGLPPITSKIEIRGQGYAIVRAPDAPRFRILDVSESGHLTLDNLRIANGDLTERGGGIRAYGPLTLSNSAVTDNSTGDLGGGIFARGAEVTLVASTVSGNSARRGAGIAAYEESIVSISDSAITSNVARSRGGGLLLYASYGASTISNSTISYNSAASGGGVRVSFYSALEILDSDLIGNSARLEGGGIFVSLSYLNLERARVMENSAQRGGGMFRGSNYFDVKVVDTTVARNTASQAGGGFYLYGYTGFNEISLTNTTVSGNSAEKGGGIYENTGYYRNESSIRHSTITQNEATTGGGVFFTTEYGYNHPITNTIIADNRGGNCGGPAALEGSGNLDDDGTCPGSSSIASGVDFDPELASNGGPTETHALLEGSVAIDAGGNCQLESDQRGAPRDELCDTGSVEFGAEVPEEVEVSTAGLDLDEVSCRNRTQGRRGKSATVATSWSCRGLGVDHSPGDRLLLSALATANGAAPVGGSISGLTGTPRVICRNKTSGRKVSFRSADVTFSCEAEGLEVTAGDSIRLKIKGRS